MSEKDAQQKKVLIVDDDEFLLEMYALKFKEVGFKVEIAETGREAVDKAGAFAPDIILLDIVLPEMDGFEVLSEIRHNKKVPRSLVIMLTNLGQKDDTQRSIRLGADDYIIKAHFTPSEVVEKVITLLAKQKQ
ncbi:MAG: putative OmpR family two-component system response regulator [Parcubacteria group bacterium Gr01-1014_29]|nr:MAG: putative OmpR family two-component system response regulator [Parcubacteria group bacterium Gr01-1014_29]